jgi:Xaa-Pro aminopeptidase
VRKAQKAATDFIQDKLTRSELAKGFEADLAARQVIEQAGYGKYFIHRTGHNIYTELHGPGAHLDSLETLDERPLIPGTCFSVEPGIYLPGEFGVRQEYDLYISKDHTLSIYGGVQDAITTLF